MSRHFTQMVQSLRHGWLWHTTACGLLQLLIAGLIVSTPALAQTPKSSAKGTGQVLIGVPFKLPNPHVRGYSYPETQTTILKHVNAGDQTWITNHAWGLWTALTTTLLPGVRVYETWQSPSNGEILSPGPLSGGTAQVLHRVHKPRQFHGRQFAEVPTPSGVQLPPTSNQVLVTVNWSPEMVTDVIKHGYLSSAKLNQLQSNGTTSITLNDRALSLKPTYLWMGAPLLVGRRYYQLSTWPGPQDSPGGYPSNLWGQCVWVDTQDQTAGAGTGASDPTCSSNGSSRTPATTYGLGNFIQFKLSEREAGEWKTEGINVTVGSQTYYPKAGEVVILVAMHVGTREMTEWTWQTFWWEPDPTRPHAPSSAAVARARPAQLRGAARHYAQCTAYQMVTPNQPITGGSSTQPHLCYSPYLEAPFTNVVTPTHTSPDLPDSQPWTYQGKTYNFSVGVQTNCMSCHIQAAYPQTNKAPGYTADRYIDLNSPAFSTFLKMDFSWSIVQNVK